MGQILIRDIDEQTLARFERRARSAGKTPEDLVREMILDLERVPVGKLQRDEAFARMDAIRARVGAGRSLDWATLRDERDAHPSASGLDGDC